jgi:DNA mismatch repair protein MutS2
MTAAAGRGIAPAVLETLEFPAALDLVAAHAAGPLGAARVRSRRPGLNASAVRDALAQVSELAGFLLTDDALRAEAVPDLAPVLELLRVPGSVLEGPAFADIAAALAAARVVAGELNRLKERLPRTVVLLTELPPRTIDTRLTSSIAPDGAVLDGASKELGRARSAVREARNALVARLESLLKKLDASDRAPDAAVTVRNGRYVIPVRGGGRGKLGGIVHDESATRGTLFIEPPEAIELGNELRAAELAEHREVLRVLRELTDLVRGHADALALGWEMCVAFDDLAARARYAVETNGFAPTIDDGPLTIKQGRHPLLVAGSSVVVPFDLELARDEFTVLVSGPNTGGKTVLIKAVGLLGLLAQSGIIPPIGPGSSLPIFTSVFADIGDRQSIAASLSTFAAHVRELREILAGAGPGTLVLLDEIGSGTDPAEGGALAAAVLRALTRRRVITLVTTHLGALKRLATETVGVVNASLQFDADTLTPTYRLLKGVPGRSYGLAIAQRLGVPEDVLSDARQAVPDAERALDALLADVEARGRELESRTRELELSADHLRLDQENVAARATALAERERVVRERERSGEKAARDQARAYLLEARKRVEEALGVARAAVDEATAREARRLVEQAIDEARETPKSAPGPSGVGDVGVGDRVQTDSGMDGTVAEIRGDGSVVLVVNNVRVVLPRGTRLSPAGKARVGTEPAPAARRPPRAAYPPAGAGPGQASADEASGPTTEVDFRGMRIDELESALDHAIDEAVLSDLPYLRIIHGKGTGALRQRVREILEHDPRVSSFALAPANQGGDGVTVVELA